MLYKDHYDLMREHYSICVNPAYNKNTLFYDIIYNPKETNFLKDARLRGNKAMNGKMMFLNQAKYAFNLWTNITPEIDDEVIKLLDLWLRLEF